MVSTFFPSEVLINYEQYRRKIESNLSEDQEPELYKGLYRKMQFNPDEFEEMLANKFSQKFHLPLDFKSPSVYMLENNWRPSYFQRWIDELREDPNFAEDFSRDLVVIKDLEGSQGRGVSVRKAKHIRSKDLKPKTLIEPFILSQPIISDKDGKAHDGCMRYGLISVVDDNGDVAFEHAGGYWRLSPTPLETETRYFKDKFVANLSRSALAQKANAEELLEASFLVQHVTLHMLSSYYEREFSATNN